jgi:hypothetical protein
MGAPKPPTTIAHRYAAVARSPILRPCVERMRLDHDQHRDAAQPVKVGASSLDNARHRRFVDYAQGWRHGRRSKVVTKSMSCRMECQTEQYFSRGQGDGTLDGLGRYRAGTTK